MDLIEKLIDIDLATLQENCPECWMYTDVTFKVYFGPWNKGTTYACIAFDFLRGRVIEYDTNQDFVKGVNFTLTSTTPIYPGH